MTKNNLKVVKSDNKKQQELKEKNKSLEAAISQIDQNFGKGSVMRLGQQQALDVEATHTANRLLWKTDAPKNRQKKPSRPEMAGFSLLRSFSSRRRYP